MNTKRFAWRGSGTTFIAIAGLTVSFTSQAASIPTGNQALVDFGTPTVDTGDIITGTAFTIGNLTSTPNNSGVFAGMPSQLMGAVTFSPGDPTSLTFSNPVFGDFTSTSIEAFPATVGTNGAATHVFFVIGDWTPGTYPQSLGATGGPFESQLTITFSQTPAVIGAISDSATFATPVPTPIPEPATSWLLGISVAALVGIAYQRRNGTTVQAQRQEIRYD